MKELKYKDLQKDELYKYRNNRNEEEKRKKKIYEDAKKMYIIAGIAIFCIILLTVIIFSVFKKEKKDITVRYSNGEKVAEKTVKKLASKGEKGRGRIYVGDIIKRLNSGKYEEVYLRLDEDFKKKRFPTLESFKTHIETNYPKVMAIKEKRSEILDKYFVMKADIFNPNVKDEIEARNARDVYFVIKEIGFDEYTFSMS